MISAFMLAVSVDLILIAVCCLALDHDQEISKSRVKSKAAGGWGKVDTMIVKTSSLTLPHPSLFTIRLAVTIMTAFVLL